MFLLVGARRYRTLLAGVVLFAAVILSVFLAAPQRFHDASETLLYKKGERGVFIASRQKPWERSLATFRERPWLGLGFGAADNSADSNFTYVTQGQQTRERGSSYLTMLETTGVIGTLPCGLLILCLLWQVSRVFSRLRSTGEVNQPAVVAALIITGGLVNAAFEDWLLAIGYYMCVIFWVLAFSLRDWMDCPAWSEAPRSIQRSVGAVVQALR
jgi:O-antigen ligase